MKDTRRTLILVGLFVVIIATLLSLPFASPTGAQSVASLKYGDIVTGEVTSSTRQVSYKFSGSKGDTVIVEVDSRIITGDQVDYSDLNATLTCTDSTGKKLIDSGSSRPTGGMVLPADGDYTIDVQPSKDAKDKSAIGKFRLILSQAKALKPGATVTGSATFAASPYYLIPTDQNFSLSFEQALKAKENNYITLQFLSIEDPSDNQTGGFLTNAAIQTPFITVASFTFDVTTPTSVIKTPILQVQLTALGAQTPVDFKLTLQSAR